MTERVRNKEEKEENLMKNTANILENSGSLITSSPSTEASEGSGDQSVTNARLDGVGGSASVPEADNIMAKPNRQNISGHNTQMSSNTVKPICPPVPPKLGMCVCCL